MRDAETTIGNLADKQTVAFIGVADEEGFPIVKAMLAPRKREGIKVDVYKRQNFDCIILDVCDVTIGDNVFLAPRVCIYTARCV